MKNFVKKMILGLLFTPVRALTLVRAKIDSQRSVRSIHSQCSSYVHNEKKIIYFTIFVFYKDGGSCSRFEYREEERDLFLSERQILEGLVGL